MNSFKEKASNSYPRPVMLTVTHQIYHIIDVVLYFFRHCNVVSVILTGSWARGSGRFSQKNGKIMILSDYDIIIVVKPRSFLRTIFLKRDVEQRLLKNLKRMGLTSSVSIQVTTENRLKSRGPSFFSYDLKLHGITCYGRNLIGSTSGIRGRIPVEDIVLLLLNRLTEVIAGLILVPTHNTAEENLQVSMLLVKKGYFSILQSILAMNDIQIFDDQALKTTEDRLGCLQELYDEIAFRYRNLILEKVINIQDFIKEWNVFLQCWYNVVHAILSNWIGDERQERNLTVLLLEYNIRSSENVSKRIMKIMLRLFECRSLALSNFTDLLFLLIKGDTSLFIPITYFAFLSSPQFLVNKYSRESSCFETTFIERSISTWAIAKGGHPPATINPKVLCK